MGAVRHRDILSNGRSIAAIVNAAIFKIEACYELGDRMIVGYPWPTYATLGVFRGMKQFMFF